MSESADLEALARAAASDPEDVAAKADLWSAIIGLPAWWLIPRGRDAEVSPMVVEVQGKAMLAAFTTGERCRTFAQRKGIDFVDAQQGLAIPPKDFLKFFDAWKQAGVWGVVFDPRDHALTAPLASLQA